MKERWLLHLRQTISHVQFYFVLNVDSTLCRHTGYYIHPEPLQPEFDIGGIFSQELIISLQDFLNHMPLVGNHVARLLQHVLFQFCFNVLHKF